MEVRVESSNVAAVATACRKLRRMMEKEGIPSELRKREAYLPPSKARRRKRNEAAKQRKRDAKKANWNRAKY